MSTFNGIVTEFPNIRIDCFRHYPDLPTPAACFLSHVHSDHLFGLDTLKSPFVYCSAATRRLLLKMEKYPHRINFSKGVLESRKQTYKHLKTILRPLPMNSPVDLELSPKSRIKVTLLDANHCPGAVMFLIEGDSKAILYTGDIRAETWWTNALARHPCLIPYINTSKRLDCIYLDTTFASHHDIHRKFPTKAEGLSELRHKLSEHTAPNTIFYFRAWTLGYEDVWILLNRALQSQIHVDEYQVRLFRSIAEDGLGAEPGPVLSGYKVGNAEQPGCLTVNPDVSIHSCEPGTPCHARIKKNKNVVWITPIISRLEDGSEIAEIGAGGGHGDLYQHQDEVNMEDQTVVDALRLLYERTCPDTALIEAFNERIADLKYGQNLTFEGLGFDTASEVTLRDFLTALAKRSNINSEDSNQTPPKVIHFPYSRHSSYDELRHLVSIFRPRDICPCTVDLDRWEKDQLSMESLFGNVCSDRSFKYDKDAKREIQRRRPPEDIDAEANSQRNGENTQSQASEPEEPDLQQTLQQRVSCEADKQSLNPTPSTVSPNSKTTAAAEVNMQRALDKVALRKIWHAANAGSNYYSPARVIPFAIEAQQDLPQTDTIDLEMKAQSEKATSSKSIESSNPAEEEDKMEGGQLYSQERDVHLRTEAFDAALDCMETGDDLIWRNIKLQSLGRGYHTHPEPDL